jgi:hypothetical protein
MIKFILSLIIPIIFGAGLIFLFFPRQRNKFFSNWLHRIEFLILSFGLGSVLVTYLMFWWGVAKLPFKIFIILITTISAVFLILALIKLVNYRRKIKAAIKENQIEQKIEKNKTSIIKKVLQTLLILIIIFEIVFSFVESGLRPHIYVDIFNNWGRKAKLLFYQPDEFFNNQSQIFLGKDEGYDSYPMHLPFFSFWSNSWQGEFDDVLVNLIPALYFLGLIVFVFLTLRPLIGRFKSLAFSAIFATLPLFNYHSFNYYADLPLAFYLTVATVLFFKYLKNNNRTDLILSSLFAAASVWVKNSGLPLSAVIFITFLTYLFCEKIARQLMKIFTKDSLSPSTNQAGKPAGRVGVANSKDFFIYLFYFLCFIGPWLIFKKIFTFHFIALAPSEFFHPEIFLQVIKELLLTDSFHLWPIMFILILIISWRQLLSEKNIYLFLIIIGFICAYLCLYLFTESYQYVFDGTIVSRNFLALTPLSIILAGILVREY